MLYSFLKFLHVLGVVLLIGNVTITAFWKVFADRTGEPSLVAHAQYLVTLTDWIFTLAGIVLILVGGYGMVLTEGIDPFGASWLVWGQLLFLLSGVIWIAVLVPAQVRQATAARTFRAGEDIPASYWKDARQWLIWGIVATVPLVAATFLMVMKL